MGLTRDRVLQRLTFQIFHSDKGSAIFFTDIVNGASVGVVESGSCVRFALEARERLRVAGDIFEQEFERDKAVEAKVLCLVDHAHPAAPQLLYDVVVRDGLTNEFVKVRHNAAILGCELCRVNELKIFVQI